MWGSERAGIPRQNGQIFLLYICSKKNFSLSLYQQNLNSKTNMKESSNTMTLFLQLYFCLFCIVYMSYLKFNLNNIFQVDRIKLFQVFSWFPDTWKVKFNLSRSLSGIFVECENFSIHKQTCIEFLTFLTEAHWVMCIL